jgi:hypothetical protein
MAIPALTHSSETWTLTPPPPKKKQKEKVLSLDIKFLRNVARCTLKDRIIKAVIRNGINILNLNNIIQNNGLNFIHHERMESESISKQLLDCAPRGTRSIGRLRLLWKDQPIL